MRHSAETLRVQHVAANWWEGHSCCTDWTQHTFIALKSSSHSQVSSWTGRPTYLPDDCLSSTQWRPCASLVCCAMSLSGVIKCVCVCACVCVCVCVRACVRACVCVCEWGREGGRRERERASQSVCSLHLLLLCSCSFNFVLFKVFFLLKYPLHHQTVSWVWSQPHFSSPLRYNPNLIIYLLQKVHWNICNFTIKIKPYERVIYVSQSLTHQTYSLYRLSWNDSV